MRIHEPGKDDFTRAIDLVHSLAMFLQPGIAQSISYGSHRDNFPAQAQNRPIFDDAQFLQLRSAMWASIPRCRSESEKLADVSQEQRGMLFRSFTGCGHTREV